MSILSRIFKKKDPIQKQIKALKKMDQDSEEAKDAVDKLEETMKSLTGKKFMPRSGDKIDYTLVKGPNGNYTTRINPINRHSAYGFALRRANKLNRVRRFTVNRMGYPQFLTDQ